MEYSIGQQVIVRINSRVFVAIICDKFDNGEYEVVLPSSMTMVIKGSDIIDLASITPP